MLKQELKTQELNNAQGFYQSVQDFKSKLRALTKNKKPPNEQIQDYSTPDALPRELFQVAFAKEMPACSRSTSSVANTGPLRKSSNLLEPSSSSSSGSALNFTQAFQANQMQETMASMMATLICNTQMNQRQQHGQLKLALSTPSRRSTLALCDQQTPSPSVATNAITTPTGRGVLEETVNKPISKPDTNMPSGDKTLVAGDELPLSPAEQAKPMLAA